MKTTFFLIFAVFGYVTATHGYDNAHYKFEYGVHDPHTHDHKSQHEHRDGHHVHGGYTLKEADGTHRIVKYKSGPHSGFEAVVERVGHAQHPAHYGGHGGATSYVGVTHWANQGSDGGHGY
ncbi:adult-specific cuticular protein ACP-20-like [Diorhabda carinulata]|uniref:adult-specific cuticular protein ACP-20-like n=1 Tax=Diorhabda carinulata TaxID=1163345 RepID=UPI0025A01DE7|nr:adult-specific cuticular protein ACP-20-like [Diorhabda carinulata]